MTTATGICALPKLVEQGVAALVPDVHVEQHDGNVARQTSRAALERARLAHLVTAELEVDPAEQADRRFIVDDENDVFRFPLRHPGGSLVNENGASRHPVPQVPRGV